MNPLTAIFLIAASAQLVAPPAGGTGQASAPSGEAARYGWHRNEDGSLSYIVHVAPGEIATIANNNEVYLHMPEAVRPEVSQVIVRIGDSVPERDPPEAELIERRRQQALAGPSLTTLDNRQAGRMREIDPSTGGNDPMQNVQFPSPNASAGPSSMQAFPSAQNTAAPSNFAQPNVQSRNPAVAGRGAADPQQGYAATSASGFAANDPPSMFPQPPQQPAYPPNGSSLTAQPATGTLYPTTPVGPAARGANPDAFTAPQSFGAASANQYGQTGAYGQPSTAPATLPSTGTGYSYGNAADYRGGTSPLTSGSSPLYAPNGQGYSNAGGLSGQPSVGSGPGYADAYGPRLASTNPALGGGLGTLPPDRGYTATELERTLAQERRDFESQRRDFDQKYEQAKQAYDALKGTNEQLKEAKSIEVEEARKKAEDEHASKSLLWQGMLIFSIAVNGYMFVLLRGLFTKYRNLQQNTRNSMSLAS